MEDPDAVKVDEEVEERPAFVVRLEEGAVPLDLVKLHEALTRGDIDEARLVGENDARDALGVPEELVDVVVTDDVLVVAFAADESTVDDLVALVSDEPVQGSDDRAEVEPFRDRLGAVLALGRPVVVVGALEDEAQALGHEPDLRRLAPTEEVQRELPDAVVRRHLEHGLLPPLPGRVERLDRRGRRRLDAGLAGGFAREPSDAVVGLADRVVEVELGGKVPLAVVGVLAADVVGVEGQQGLVRGHAGRARVELDHEVIVHVAHRVALEAKLVGEVDEDVLDLFFTERDLRLVGPRRVRLAEAGESTAAVVACRRFVVAKAHRRVCAALERRSLGTAVASSAVEPLLGIAYRDNEISFVVTSLEGRAVILVPLTECRSYAGNPIVAGWRSGVGSGKACSPRRASSSLA